MARPKSDYPARDTLITVALTTDELEFLQAALAREPGGFDARAGGGAPLSVFLRNLGLARTQELIGIPFGEYMAKRAGQGTTKARDARRQPGRPRRR